MRILVYIKSVQLYVKERKSNNGDDDNNMLWYSSKPSSIFVTFTKSCMGIVVDNYIKKSNDGTTFHMNIKFLT